MKKTIIAVVALFMVLVSSSAYAGSAAVGARVSTLGLGIDGAGKLSDSLAIRAGFNYASYDYSGTESDINYDFELDLMSVPVVVDWHPFKGAFRLSGGVLYNGNEVNLTASQNAEYTINDVTYTAAEIGTLDGNIVFNNFAPYVGLGFDTSFAKESGFGFVFELGVVFQGTPDSTLKTSGLLSDPLNPGYDQLQSDLDAEQADLQDALDSFKYYPVIGAGITYRF